jgi:site-specific recombinase XerD
MDTTTALVPQTASRATPLRLTDLPADKHPAAMYLAHLSPGSRRTMHQALDTIAGILSSGRLDAWTMPWAELRAQHTEAVRAELAARFAPATANKCLAALRGVLRQCRRLHLMSANDAMDAADVSGVRGRREPAGRALSRGELKALFEACARDPRPQGRRDSCAIAILHAGGLRRAELSTLDVSDYDGETGALKVRCGKGNAERIVFLNAGAQQAVAEWLRVRGGEPGPLLCSINKGGVLIPGRPSPQLAWVVLRTRARQAGITVPFSPHSLRRTFVGDLLEVGVDISTVQQLAGHASVVTTQRYDRRPLAARRAAASKLHTPYLAPRAA